MIPYQDQRVYLVVHRLTVSISWFRQKKKQKVTITRQRGKIEIIEPSVIDEELSKRVNPSTERERFSSTPQNSSRTRSILFRDRFDFKTFSYLKRGRVSHSRISFEASSLKSFVSSSLKFFEGQRSRGSKRPST